MTGVRIQGELVCADPDQAQLVIRHLPEHAALTRAEPGCLAFDVVPTADPLVWRVDELFRDEAAVVAHRQRMAHGEWARATADVARRYSAGSAEVDPV